MQNLKTKLMVLVAFLCVGGVSMPAAAEDTIKLGVAGAHSGDLASYGLPSLNAANLVVKDINAKGGVLGKQVEVVAADDVCKPEIATNTATKLVSGKVPVVLGHICSGATKAALGIYQDAGVLVMSPSATDVGLTKSGDYTNFYRTIAPDDAQARLQVDFVLGTLAAKKVAVLHDKGDYGKGLAEFVKKFIEEDGRAEVILFEGITPGAVDYSAVIQKIKRKKPDAVVFGGYHPEASKLVTLMSKKKIKIPFVSDDGVKDATFIKVAGKYAEGVYATGPQDVSGNPMAQKAIKDHQETFKADPGPFFQNAYAATLALLNAIEKAGSTDAEAVAKALRNESVETPLGKISFDENGDAVGVGFLMYQVQDGVYKEVK